MKVVNLSGETHGLRPGELFVVSRGVRHRPRAVLNAQVLLIEPKGAPNTGDAVTAAKMPRLG